MPSSYITLENLLTDPQYKIICADKFELLLKWLRRGEIKTISAKSIKVTLRLIYKESSLDAAVARLPVSEDEKVQAHVAIREQAGLICRVWAKKYFTIFMRDGVFEVFESFAFGDPIRNLEVDGSFWRDAWIDERKWVVVNDDIDGLSRHEFEHVSFLREDVDQIFRNNTTQNKNGVGRKKDFFEESSVVKCCKDILARFPNMSRTDWESKVRENIADLPERTTFHNLYGHIWTKHHRVQKSKN